MRKFAVIFTDKSSTTIEADNFSLDTDGRASFWNGSYKLVAVFADVTDVFQL